MLGMEQQKIQCVLPTSQGTLALPCKMRIAGSLKFTKTILKNMAGLLRGVLLAEYTKKNVPTAAPGRIGIHDLQYLEQPLLALLERSGKIIFAIYGDR